MITKKVAFWAAVQIQICNANNICNNNKIFLKTYCKNQCCFHVDVYLSTVEKLGWFRCIYRSIYFLIRIWWCEGNIDIETIFQNIASSMPWTMDMWWRLFFSKISQIISRAKRIVGYSGYFQLNSRHIFK